jgi:hypothetical protein
MLKTRLIATVSAVALSLAALSAPAFATTMHNTKPAMHHVVKKVHYHYVSGKIVSIDKAASMITLSNGKTYRVSHKAIAHYKVGQHVRLRIA